MKVSAITESSEEDKLRRNIFIHLSNSFMSNPTETNPTKEPSPVDKTNPKLGIEKLQEFTIFPKEVIDGRTVITA